jgi:glycosyltransferase involved in cell wall biosynthesis
LETPADSQSIRNLYDWADTVVVPLKANLHASGITVLAEAALFGVPAVRSDTGGLRAYFSDEEGRCVPIGDVIALREAALELAANNERRLALAANTQKRIVVDHLNSHSYAVRHRELTRQLIRAGETDDCAKACAPGNEFWRRAKTCGPTKWLM